MADSVIERLMQTNPDLEVWWDSSPLVYASWMKSMIERAPAARKQGFFAIAYFRWSGNGKRRSHTQAFASA